MQRTSEEWVAAGRARLLELKAQQDELAELAAHLNAATARWLELMLDFRAQGAIWGDFACWLASRYGITVREAREYVRVAEALEELPALRAAFRQGELTLTKVRALTRVASPASEAMLLGLARELSASQLERALRAYRRVSLDEARKSHRLEYVDYRWEEDGSLVLRARLAADDGTVLIQALDAARERVWEKRHAVAPRPAYPDTPEGFEPPRSPQLEALVELAHTARAAVDRSERRTDLVVHVDAAALADDGPGRSDLEAGPLIAPETARRLGCDADQITVVEQGGLPASVGRRRRTVTPQLRRLVDARDRGSCQWPGCDRERHLAAHHRRHWAQGGETSLDNLILLCHQHHRLVHEGGYTIEEHPAGSGFRFRNRSGVLCPSAPSRPPPGHVDALIRQNRQAALRIDAHTARGASCDRMDFVYTVRALHDILE